MKALFTGFFAILALSSTALAIDPLEPLQEALIKRHQAITNNSCDLEAPVPEETYHLGSGRKLVLIPCISGAYQTSYRGYTMDEKLTDIQPLMVLSYDPLSKSVVAELDLTSPSFNLKTGTLSTFAKGRGIGDCGQSSQTKIKVTAYGISVSTTEIRDKSKCDGKMTNWPVVFKQK